MRSLHPCCQQLTGEDGMQDWARSRQRRGGMHDSSETRHVLCQHIPVCLQGLSQDAEEHLVLNPHAPAITMFGMLLLKTEERLLHNTEVKAGIIQVTSNQSCAQQHYEIHVVYS